MWVGGSRRPAWCVAVALGAKPGTKLHWRTIRVRWVGEPVGEARGVAGDATLPTTRGAETRLVVVEPEPQHLARWSYLGLG